MKKVYTILATALLATLFSGQVMGQSKTWSGSSGGSWTTASNWTPSGVPMSTNTVTIPNGSSVSIPTGTNAVCSTLTLSGGANANSLTISGNANLAVSGSITLGAPTKANDFTAITIEQGSLSSSSIALSSTDNNNKAVYVSTTDGTIDVSNDITAGSSGNSSRNYINVGAGGTLIVGGAFPASNTMIDNTVAGGITTIEFKSSAAQNIPAGNYGSITISGGGAKTTAGNVTINGTLTLTSGVINTTSTNLLIFADNATVSGASNSSYVDGPVSKIGNEAFTFPVGDGGYYTPIQIAAPGSTTDRFTAQYFHQSATIAAPAPASGNVSPKEYWSITRPVGTSNPTVTVNYDIAGRNYSYIANAGFSLLSSSGGSSPWAATSGATQFVTSSSPKQASKSYNSLNTFIALGNPSDRAPVLPVTFGTIKAFEKGTGVQVDWTSYSEQNLANYQVERSADGINFTSIGEVAPRNVTDATNYNFFDAMPLSGTSFYRIRNNDIDGKSGLSTIVKVNLNKNIKTINVYPNPVRGNRVSFQTSDLAKGLYNVEVYNTMGSRVFSQALNHAGGAITQTLSLPTLQSGSYTLRINGTSSSSIHKITILQ